MSIALALSVTGQIAASARLGDTALDQALQGAWCNSDDKGKTCWGFDIFDKGKSSYCGRIPETGTIAAGTSTYRILGNQICHRVTSLNNESLLKVGEQFCFEILDIDAKQQVFRSEGTSEVTTIYRMRVEDVKCPRGGV